MGMHRRTGQTPESPKFLLLFPHTAWPGLHPARPLLFLEFETDREKRGDAEARRSEDSGDGQTLDTSLCSAPPRLRVMPDRAFINGLSAGAAGAAFVVGSVKRRSVRPLLDQERSSRRGDPP